MSETTGKKFIKYGDKQFPMDGYTLDQAKQIMARHFPELADPEVKTEKAGDGTIYIFTKKAGRKGAGKNVPTADVQRALRQVKPAHIPPSLVKAAIEREAGRDAKLDHLLINVQIAEERAVDQLRDRLLDVPPAVALDGEALL